jgi:general secretion pathway protein G
MPSNRHPAYETPRDLRARVGKQRAHGQAGFTMIELLVVMVIAAILLALGVPTFIHAKKTSKQKIVIAAAANYRTAIEGFRLDHGNRVPELGSPTDWPPKTTLPVARQFEVGPIDQFGKPYMKTAGPEALRTGMAALGAPGVATTPDMTGRIVYEPGPPPGVGGVSTTYRLRVEVLDGSTWKTACEIGNMAGLEDTC